MLDRHRSAAVVTAYSLLTAVMTYPQVFRLSSGTRDGGDPLLNTWILWWESSSIVRGNFAGFFDTNVFFPHDRTLAYSEFLIPQALAATPLLLLFDNPLIAYNIVLLGSFVVTAFAMYPRGYRVDVSTDGANWSTVAEDPDVNLTVLDVVDRQLEIGVPGTSARYLRLVQTGRDAERGWTVFELDVLTDADDGR